MEKSIPLYTCSASDYMKFDHKGRDRWRSHLMELSGKGSTILDAENSLREDADHCKAQVVTDLRYVINPLPANNTSQEIYIKGTGVIFY